MRRTRLLVTMIVVVAGCGDNGSRHPAPTAAELRGVYDVTVQRSVLINGSTSLTVASAGGEGDELALFFPMPGVALRGTLHDGAVDLEGTPTNSDVIAPVDGNARVEKRSGVLRIVGSFTVERDTYDFDMRRAVDADARPFGGRFRLAFPGSPGVCRCPTTADVTIDVEREGFGDTSETSELDAAGVAVSTIHAADVLVSPGGRFALKTTYETPPGQGCRVLSMYSPCRLLLDGVVATADSAASTAAFFELLDGLTVNIGRGSITIDRLP